MTQAQQLHETKFRHPISTKDRNRNSMNENINAKTNPGLSKKISKYPMVCNSPSAVPAPETNAQKGQCLHNTNQTNICKGNEKWFAWGIMQCLSVQGNNTNGKRCIHRQCPETGKTRKHLRARKTRLFIVRAVAKIDVTNCLRGVS
jgi:hypothetical protein